MSMTGKTVLVTGATNGIGKITALELAKMGARVLLVARDPSKGAATLEEIKRVVPDANLELLLADLSLMADTRKLADEVKSKVAALDVLVNNAGAIFTERKVTSEGLEETFALNHMNYFLLTNLLLGELKDAPAARIVNVSSEAHRYGRVNFDDLQSLKGFSGMSVYGTSKLMNILFSNALVRRLEGTRVVTNALHPGVVATGFAQSSTGPWKWLFGLLRYIPGAMIPPERGAETSVYLASSSEVEGVTGAYWSNKRLTKAASVTQDRDVQERLWLESTRIAGLE